MLTNTTTEYALNTHADAQAVADRINEAAAAGHTVTINGTRKAKARHWTTRPADVYNNGTLEVHCEPRSARAQSGYSYTKIGRTVTVTIEEG